MSLTGYDMNRLDGKHRLLAGLAAAASLLLPSGRALAENAHPAVVRVIAPDRGGASLGSGALVAVSDSHGLVVTNWHVVRYAAGPVMVIFPDGFRTGAAVMKIDRDWDLAALAVWRPNAEPIPLATRTPQPGEALTIAGYGRGWYRTTAGRCVQYVSPGGSLPFEMVELSTSARQGDSGGPILNSRGELAGVLFGSAGGRTTGSYCGRVRWFLEEPLAMLQHLPPNPAVMAQRQLPQPAQSTTTAITPEPGNATVSVAQPAGRELAGLSSFEQPVPRPQHRESERLPQRDREPDDKATAAVHYETPARPPTRAEQIKTVLAAIGLLALLFHGLRFLALAAQ